MIINTEHIDINEHFVGREFEKERLFQIAKGGSASIIIVHGRRRVGKTELLEQAFRTRNLLKFEGLEGQNKSAQMQVVLDKLSVYTGDPLISKIRCTRWREIFELIYRHTAEGEWTIYFEEVQWLANYRGEFVSDFKYVWDNSFRRNPDLVVLLCGSATSFMTKRVVKSKGLYNRSQHELPVRPFSLVETQAFMGSEYDQQSVLEAYLTVGGIPEYLNYLRKDPSFRVSLKKESFTPGGVFVSEYEKVFVSSLGKVARYHQIIDFIAAKGSVTRDELSRGLKITKGGTLSVTLSDLEEAGLIESYKPILSDHGHRGAMYGVLDPYLQYYNWFIRPKLREIKKGEFVGRLDRAFDTRRYQQFLGYAFERFCRNHHATFADILNIGGIDYSYGPILRKGTMKNAQGEERGVQIDLAFDRADRVLTVFECKFRAGSIGIDVIDEMEQKLQNLFQGKSRPIQRVLVTISPPSSTLVERDYFHRIITLAELFRKTT